MGDLISRKALIEELKKSRKYHAQNGRELELLCRCENIVNEQPTVEAVPVQALTDAILDKTKVVRCKDCKHSDLPAVLTRKYGKAGTLTCHNRYSPCNNRNVNEKDFCSHGEMRTSAE